MAGSSEMSGVELSINAGTKFTSSTAADLNDTGANIYFDAGGLDGSKVIFYVRADGDEAASIVVKDGAEYSGGAVGDLTQATTVGGEYIIGPLETARFKDSDGYINLQLGTTGSTVKLYARSILLP